MKKLLIFFSVIFLIIGVIACSKSDDSDGGTDKKELFVKSDKEKIVIGELVKFSAFTKEGKGVKDATFYINGNKISNEYKFDKKGVYNVVAKSAGYKTSSPIAINVTEGGEVIAEKIELSADRGTLYVGETVKFTVKQKGKEVSGYQIKIVGGENITGNTWTPKAKGVYKFIATLGDKISNEISVEAVNVSTGSYKLDDKNYAIAEVTFGVSGNSEKKAILYTDGKEKYFVFMLFAYSSESDYSVLSMKVIVDDPVTKVVFPQDADPSKIKFISVSTFVNKKLASTIKAEDFANVNVEWKEKMDNEGIGAIDYSILSKDNKFALKFSGDYEGTFIIINENAKSANFLKTYSTLGFVKK
ncbi:hypothetical protein HX052_16910 [Myroides marinus]|uniref:hypothetical protein n=1 Tax=Myroides marinus TaxID=703342 RepID=UPI002575892E|nr:hypothetical protein [Myroides marinus]MDM1367841.1 hypothetical protein [Myroides marinus]MDM1373699.1 hypothetical protein [Myroides marinus]MDM1376219.1 hypothetical protein [Myroides marinus]MDM1382281.1 hypothetical protein [Myroides marinus]MDM1391619.1 hypothetical protein [Myroides marinus]